MNRFRYRLLAVLALVAFAPLAGLLEPALAWLGLGVAALASALFVRAELREFCPTVEIWGGPCDPAGLQYPVDSRSLWGLDPDGLEARIRILEGVPQVDYPGIGPRFNPAYVAWWGLQAFNRCCDTSADRCPVAFAASVKWLQANARPRFGTGLAWEYAFDWPNGATTLRAPWISAMAQGLAISLLVRAAGERKDPALLDLARAAVEPFRHDLEAGGVRTTLHGATFYEEYPVRPETRVLDGSLFALVGLGELARAIGDTDIDGLFREGARGIAENLALWDYGGWWTRYGSFGALSTAEYHLLNGLLAQVVGRMAGDARLVERGEAWERSARSAPHRLAATAANRWVQLWSRADSAGRR